MAIPSTNWRYDDADVANWLKQADAEPDLAKRNALYKQIQQQLADDAVNFVAVLALHICDGAS